MASDLNFFVIIIFLIKKLKHLDVPHFLRCESNFQWEHGAGALV